MGPSDGANFLIDWIRPALCRLPEPTRVVTSRAVRTSAQLVVIALINPHWSLPVIIRGQQLTMQKWPMQPKLMFSFVVFKVRLYEVIQNHLIPPFGATRVSINNSNLRVLSAPSTSNHPRTG